jgi:N-acetylmuramoyl-L-alanine amidase
LGQAVLADLLKAGYSSSFIINPDGADLALTERTAIATRRRADLFLSLHHDSVQPHYLQKWQAADGSHQNFSDRFAGYSVFFSRFSPAAAASEQFARALAAAMFATGARPSLHHNEPIAGEGRPLLDSRTGVYQFDELAVLRSSTIPAILLEAGVIVNRLEEQRVSTEMFRRKVAGAIVSAVNTRCALEGRER